MEKCQEWDGVSPLQSHGQPLKQELELSSVISAMRLPISCTSSMTWWPHEPAVSIATGKKDARGLKLMILRSLVVCCLLSCRSLLNWCGAQMRLSESIWNCNVPRHRLPSGPWYQRRSIWAFAITSQKTRRFLGCWYLCSFDSSPYDVIYLTVSLLSWSTSAAKPRTSTVWPHLQMCSSSCILLLLSQIYR